LLKKKKKKKKKKGKKQQDPDVKQPLRNHLQGIILIIQSNLKRAQKAIAKCFFFLFFQILTSEMAPRLTPQPTFKNKTQKFRDLNSQWQEG
jgi:hypothetical protein